MIFFNHKLPEVYLKVILSLFLIMANFLFALLEMLSRCYWNERINKNSTFVGVNLKGTSRLLQLSNYLWSTSSAFDHFNV